MHQTQSKIKEERREKKIFSTPAESKQTNE